MNNCNKNDPYEREQRRLLALYDDASSGEEDPYHDSDGEYGSDKSYQPGGSGNSETSDSEVSDVSSESEQTEDQTEEQTAEQISGNNSNTVPDNSVSCWEKTVRPIPDFTFDENSAGLKINMGAEATPLNVFEYLFTPRVLNHILECSNNYGEWLTNTNKPKTRNSRSAIFRPIAAEELKAFFGLCLLQGQMATTNMRRYFSYTDVLYYHPFFAYVMSGRRFESILRVLCCAAPNAKGKEKAQPLINMLISNYQETYNPTRELSIDESLLHFRGRLAFRVYIKNKKDRYGIKFFELTTSDGYLLNMEMYSGTIDKSTPDGTKTEALVLRLMKPYLMKGHELFMDNYYNSVTLSEKLLDYKTHTNGTLRSNRRHNPKNLVTKKLKRGEHYWLRKNRVYVSKWKDKRDVLVISTRNHPRMVSVNNRYGKQTNKPEEVAVYNNHMSGIDRCDQMTATYATPRKTIRWYKKVILYLLDVTTWNAFYLYRKYCKGNSRQYRFIQFRDELIKSLTNIPLHLEGKDLVRKQKNDSRRTERPHLRDVPNHVPNQPSGHWPEKIPGVPGPKSQKTSVFLKCRMCNKNKKRKETSFRCKGCVEKPPLCPTCFEEWHQLLDG